MAALALAVPMTPAVAQAPAAAAGSRATGTVKSTSASGLTLTTAAGQDVVVTVPDAVKVLMVAPGSKDLKSATPGTLSDARRWGIRSLVVGRHPDGEWAGADGDARVIVREGGSDCGDASGGGGGVEQGWRRDREVG